MVSLAQDTLPDRLSEKIRRDPFYKETLAHFGSLSALEKAGFFDDGLTPDEVATLADPRWAVTPLCKIKKPQNDRKPLVLATTGAFAPLHDGHLEMMEQARHVLEDEGFEVLGGFFCPAHDSYVKTKSGNAARWNADVRLALLREKIKESDWLDLDPWMCRFTPADLNFTDVLLRLKAYLIHHRPEMYDVDVAYVFGSDNSSFMRTFIRSGYAVCVNRPGFESDLDLAAQEVLPFGKGRLFFSASTQNESASRVLRLQPLCQSEARPDKPYLIRDDLAWATEGWALPNKEAALAKFFNGLEQALQNAFEPSVEIIPLSVDTQKEIVGEIARQKHVLNIDAVTSPPEIDIGFSRLFHLCDGQETLHGVLPRQNAEILKKHLHSLPSGSYTLIDDDIVSGSSMRGLESLFPDGIKVTRRISLAEELFKQSYPDRPFDIWDIVDARDFLLGSRLSGLVVRLFDSQLGRAPYIAPYVNLLSRAKLPIGTEMAFSRQILRLNLAFHEETGSHLTLADTDPDFARLMQQSGFAPSDKLCDICRAHLSLLSRNKT